ncbi:hypothetical protein [Streptomyces sp. NPDC059122]|uniref:hypothetical protein n=1 Tax=Streptomyces sp. NPDC059122 TaxID=3346732 RepID=UPI0036B5FC45
MPKSRDGRALAPRFAESAKAISTHQHRLATLLADMVPGARALRVSQRHPGLSWPSPYSRAYDTEGHPIPLTRPQRVTAARWVIRAHPEVNWDEAHDFDLVNGAMRPAADAYTVPDGGR